MKVGAAAPLHLCFSLSEPYTHDKDNMGRYLMINDGIYSETAIGKFLMHLSNRILQETKGAIASYKLMNYGHWRDHR